MNWTKEDVYYKSKNMSGNFRCLSSARRQLTHITVYCRRKNADSKMGECLAHLGEIPPLVILWFG